MLYDAIVVGLGPGGSIAAYELASKGLKVLALDKETFPRYKPCGGAISLKVEKALPFSIREAVEETIYGALFTFGSKRPLPIPSPMPVCYTARRDIFDDFLKRKAEKAGALVREGEKVTGVEELDDHVRVRTSRTMYEARVVVGADGANGIVGREALGLQEKVCAAALEAEVPCEKEKLKEFKGRLRIDFGTIPHGYAWIFPKANHLSVGVAGLSTRVKGRLREYFDAFIRNEAMLKGLDISNVHGWTVPFFYNENQRIAQGRVLVAGDAAHLVDPFLGEGIYYAVKSAQIAAGIICEKIGDAKIDLSAYSDIIKVELYPELRAAAKIGRLIYALPKIWYRIMEGEPTLMEQYYKVIRGEGSNAELYEHMISRITTRPWRFIIRWLKGFFTARH